MMVMARVLIKEDLAAYRQTFLAYLAVGPILSMGVGQGMYYFLPAEKERLRGRVTDGLTALGVMGVGFALFIGLGGNEFLARRFSNPQVARLLLWLVPYVIITIPATAAQSVMVARDRVLLASVFGVVKQLAIGIATLIPLILWKTADAPLIGNVVASVIMGSAGIALMIQSAPGGNPMPTFGGIKELLTFTLPLAVGGMFGTISKTLDQLIVGFLCPPDEFAEYSLGAMELPMIGVITGSLTAVMLADMRKSIVANDHDEALRLFRSVGEKSSLVMLPMMLFLLITAGTFIQYLFSSEFTESAIPFRFYLTLLPIRTVVFGSLLMALGKNRFIMYRAFFGLVLNGIISTFLVWNYGPWGAVVATVATVYLWDVPASIYMLALVLGKSWHQIMPFREMGKIFVDLIPVAIVSLIIAWFVENIHIEFALIAICFATFLIPYWNGRLYQYEAVKKKIANALKRQDPEV